MYTREASSLQNPDCKLFTESELIIQFNYKTFIVFLRFVPLDFYIGIFQENSYVPDITLK